MSSRVPFLSYLTVASDSGADEYGLQGTSSRGCSKERPLVCMGSWLVEVFVPWEFSYLENKIKCCSCLGGMM